MLDADEGEVELWADGDAFSEGDESIDFNVRTGLEVAVLLPRALGENRVPRDRSLGSLAEIEDELIALDLGVGLVAPVPSKAIASRSRVGADEAIVVVAENDFAGAAGGGGKVAE